MGVRVQVGVKVVEALITAWFPELGLGDSAAA
jgi:hypothetical protein